MSNEREWDRQYINQPTIRKPLISDEEIWANLHVPGVVDRARALLALHRKRMAEMLRTCRRYEWDLDNAARLIEESE